MAILKIKEWLKMKKSYSIEVTNKFHMTLEQFIKQTEERIKKGPIVDPHTGNINMKYIPMHINEDYYFTTRK